MAPKTAANKWQIYAETCSCSAAATRGGDGDGESETEQPTSQHAPLMLPLVARPTGGQPTGNFGCSSSGSLLKFHSSSSSSSSDDRLEVLGSGGRRRRRRKRQLQDGKVGAINLSRSGRRHFGTDVAAPLRLSPLSFSWRLCLLALVCFIQLQINSNSSLTEAKSIDDQPLANSKISSSHRLVAAKENLEGPAQQDTERRLQEGQVSSPPTASSSSIVVNKKETEHKTSSATITTSPETTTTTTTSPETTTTTEDGPSGANAAHYHDAHCQDLLDCEPAEGKRPTDNERLVNIQTSLQEKVKEQLIAQARTSMELFDQLSLSGGCTASLLSLMSSLGELRSFAFKFLDASAKIPSGMMYGLLSDFGDFDQCLSIRSQARVDPRDEQEEGAYSGKYCLLNLRMNYHVQMGPNGSAPEGIYPDGVLWDELVRNYWTSNSSKGFQVGVCVPSRCNQDDLQQIFKLMAESYNVHGEVGPCQDTNDIRRQQTPDVVQLVIIYVLVAILTMNLLGTLLARYLLKEDHHQSEQYSLSIRLVACFALQRNWRLFLSSHQDQAVSATIDSVGAAPLTAPSFAVSASTALNHRLRKSLSLTDFRGQGVSSEPFVTVNSMGTSTTSCSLSSTTDGSTHQDLNVVQRPVTPLLNQQLTVKTMPSPTAISMEEQQQSVNENLKPLENRNSSSLLARQSTNASLKQHQQQPNDLLSHLSGLKLLVIVWVTVGHSFLYPSASNYQYYRSIINMNITRDSVWFAATNFTLGIDMLLYMTGLIFVYKLAHCLPLGRSTGQVTKDTAKPELARAYTRTRMRHAPSVAGTILRLVARKVLRFWPTYLSVIALAVVLPLVSDGPMWPEMVERKLGHTCRSYWWANLLMVNNFHSQASVCLPSSWFVSVIMQCFLLGSCLVVAARWHSLRLAVVLALVLIVLSSAACFLLAYTKRLRAPAIKMDASFVMELDDNIFMMYTNTLNNLGPFLVGMLGGFLLLGSSSRRKANETRFNSEPKMNESSIQANQREHVIEKLSCLLFQLNLVFAVALTGLLVLSSVFFANYTPFWSAIYWSCHRLGWAVVTGYLIHQCATGRWRLLKELLSLSSFIPLSRLIFIAYLVYPIFIHAHSGLVRDGLHVNIYNMMNIYITRLVLTFSLALVLHLLVELPFCSMETLLLGGLRSSPSYGAQQRASQLKPLTQAIAEEDEEEKVSHPLLAVVQSSNFGCVQHPKFELKPEAGTQTQISPKTRREIPKARDDS